MRIHSYRSVPSGYFCSSLLIIRAALALLLFTLPCTRVLAQENVPRLSLVAHPSGNSIQLRWAVGETKDWLAANRHGYRLTRTTTHRNGTELSRSRQLASRTVLADPLLPATVWPADELSQVAREVVSGQNWNNLPQGDDLGAAAQVQRDGDNRLFFAHLLADRDYQLAKRLALGYTDSSARPGERYRYLLFALTAPGTESAVFAAAEGSLDDPAEVLLAAEQLSGEDGDSTLLIGWSLDGVEDQFTTYDIYRSPAGAGNFTKANEVPFLYASDLNDERNYAYFTDHPPGYGRYSYYVVGHTPFGETGPASETITLRSRPGKMSVPVRTDSVVTTETALTLHWPSVPKVVPNRWVTQRVYKADRVDAPFREVARLAVTARRWTDPAPTATGYYAVELEDAYGHLYRTAPRFGQLEDRTPPATPADFSGTDRGDGVIDLSWGENTEADLAGYRLFRALSRGAAFAPVEVHALHYHGYRDDLRDKIFNDTVYYKLQAEDQRGNASRKTAVLAVGRADIFPPSAPLLLSARATAGGVGLTWRVSESPDVARHELRRRAHGTRTWVPLVGFTPGEAAGFARPGFDPGGQTSYVDEAELGRGRYDYRLVVYDRSGNVASSDVLTVRPYNDGRRGRIERLRGRYTCRDTTVVPPLAETFGYTMAELMAFYEAENYLTVDSRRKIIYAMEVNGLIAPEESGDWADLSDESFYVRIKRIAADYLPRVEATDCRIELSWDYRVEPGLAHFQILRSRRGSRLRPYKVLPLAHFGGAGGEAARSFRWVDGDAESGVEYVYSVVGVYGDGGYAERGGGVRVVVR